MSEDNKSMSIDDLLNALKNPKSVREADLPNIQETWSRIGSKDSFSELGLEGNELEEFLKEWIAENPYALI